MSRETQEHRWKLQELRVQARETREILARLEANGGEAPDWLLESLESAEAAIEEMEGTIRDLESQE